MYVYIEFSKMRQKTHPYIYIEHIYYAVYFIRYMVIVHTWCVLKNTFSTIKIIIEIQ